MDSKSTWLCRLCLEICNETMNIFENFQNTTIASILTQHFWFKVSKDDGLSEYICNMCWMNTKTFHNFYKRVEWRQKKFLQSKSKLNAVTNFRSVTIQLVRTKKPTRSISPALVPDLNIVKYEETESPLTAIDLQMTKEEPTDDYNAERSENVKKLDEKIHSSNKTDIDKDVCTVACNDIDLPSPDIDCQNSDEEDDHEDDDESHQSANVQSLGKTANAELNDKLRAFFEMKCEICSEPFEKFAGCIQHYRTAHNMAGYLKCCDRKFHRRSTALSHISFHSNPDAYRCDVCNKRFPIKRSLKYHIETNHQPADPNSKFDCDLCTRSYTNENGLTYHKRMKHSPEEDKKFHCTANKCGKKFLMKSALDYHIRCDHEMAYAVVCDICARVCKNKGTLQIHSKTHSAETETVKVQSRLQCNICDAWLSNKIGLQKHLQRHMETTVSCPTCKKVLQNRQSLRSHIQLVHGEKRHQCTICGKKFSTLKILKEHISQHTGQDLYNCDYCMKTFKSNANMYSHRKKAHLTEWTRDYKEKQSPGKLKQISTT